MASVEDLILTGLKGLKPKPAQNARASDKKNYSQSMSSAVALALAEACRRRGMAQIRPTDPGDLGGSGAERRLAGGLGAKKVDVSWSTEESGLIYAASIKSINFRDEVTKNFQKNLVNRRGDMLNESLTLHRRFPYAVLTGFMILDKGARCDGTDRRRSTFSNAFPKLRLFTGRSDPAGRDEQYERLFVLLVDANPFQPTIECYHVSDATTMLRLDDVLSEIVELIGERNFDMYEADCGTLRKL